MAEAKKWLDVWVFPWIAGLFLALILYGIPALTGGRQVTLFLDGPLACVGGGTAGGGHVAINGKSAPALYAYHVGIRNVGRDRLARVPLSLSFNVDLPEFSILNLQSRLGAGPEGSRVIVGEPDARSRQLVYEGLQPGEEDTITVLTNHPAQLRPTVRQEGLGVRLARPDLRGGVRYPAWAVALFGVLACWLSIGARKGANWVVGRFRRDPPGGSPLER